MRATQAIAAIRAALPAGLRAEFDAAPPDVLESLVRALACGDCSVEQAVEGFTTAIDLWEATDRGEISEAEGVAIMRSIADRQRDGHGVG